MPAFRSAIAITRTRAVAVLGRRGDVVRVARHAVADDLGVDPRAAAPRVLELLEDQDAGAFADDEAVAILVERPAGALPGRRCASTARAARAKPPTPIGVIAASEPPAIIASASPRLMISNESPMACADAEQAVQVARFGPLAPKRIDTWPDGQVDDGRRE